MGWDFLQKAKSGDPQATDQFFEQVFLPAGYFFCARRDRFPYYQWLFEIERRDELLMSQGNPSGGWVLRSPRDPSKPLNLSNLVRRVIKKSLEGTGIGWHGWHALRRGLATNLSHLGVDARVVQDILRHSNISTTLKHHIKPTPETSLEAMRQLEEAASSKMVN